MGTGRITLTVLHVLGLIVTGAAIGGLGMCALLALQALLSDVPAGADAAYRIGYRLGPSRVRFWLPCASQRSAYPYYRCSLRAATGRITPPPHWSLLTMKVLCIGALHGRFPARATATRPRTSTPQ